MSSTPTTLQPPDGEKVHSSRASSQTRMENAPAGGHHAAFAEKKELEDDNEKVELTEEDCYDELGYSFSKTKKWTILTIIFLVQTSMNFNTSLYSNGLSGISERFNVSEQGARCGAMIFLVLYAFGCELWAPWSEEFGRKPILQLSLLLVNIWQLPVALAPNFASLMVGRALGGLSSAGGSVTLGMIADIFEADHQQYAVAYIVFSSVGGSVFGPIIGGFVERFLDWRWAIWIQLIFGGFVQILHLLFVPETRSTIMMDNIAKKRRKSGENPNIYGPNELLPIRERLNLKDVFVTWGRPFKMFVTEPIVLTLSLLSGFSDALIFMQIQSFSLVFSQWNFSTIAQGLAFISFLVGYLIAWFSFFPAIKRNKKQRALHPHSEHAQYESRLWWLLWTAPCLPIGLIIFAWTSGGPPIHWMGPMVGAAIIGIANYAIYMATIDYMICAYGPYSASATGGNGWARDFLAGVLTVPATPFYENIGRPGRHLQDANTILFCISVVLVIAVYVIYWKGPALRKRSPFAEALGKSREALAGKVAAKAPEAAPAAPPVAAAPGTTGTTPRPSRPGSRAMSRRSSYAASKYASSRRNSFEAGREPPTPRPGLGSRANSHAADLHGRLAAQSRRNSALTEDEESE